MTSLFCKQLVSGSVASALFALAAAEVSAQPPLSDRDTAMAINSANGLLRDGKVDEALDAFHRIVPAEDQRAKLNYNIAVAEYRKGNIDAAEQLFSEVAGTSSPVVSSDSRYNLGNCRYAKALGVANQDKHAAIELLRQSVSDYRGALRGTPDNADARANIELAGELIRKLEQEEKQQEEKKHDQDQQDDKPNSDQTQNQEDQPEQQKPEQQNDQKQQDKSQDSASQKEESEKDESGKSDAQQSSDQQKTGAQDSKSDRQKNEEQNKASEADESQHEEQADGQRKNSEPRAEPQKSPDQKPQDEASQSDQPKPAEQSSQPKESDTGKDQPQDHQPRQRTQSGNQQHGNDQVKPEEQESKDETVPAGDLQAVTPQDAGNKPNGAVANAEPKEKLGLMTREEALKMLQSVRDRDMLRRMQQQRQERSRHVSVDRDW